MNRVMHQSGCPRLQAWDDASAPCLCKRKPYIECKAILGPKQYCGRRANTTGYCHLCRQVYEDA